DVGEDALLLTPLQSQQQRKREQHHSQPLARGRYFATSARKRGSPRIEANAGSSRRSAHTSNSLIGTSVSTRASPFSSSVSAALGSPCSDKIAAFWIAV